MDYARPATLSSPTLGSRLLRTLSRSTPSQRGSTTLSSQSSARHCSSTTPRSWSQCYDRTWRRRALAGQTMLPRASTMFSSKECSGVSARCLNSSASVASWWTPSTRRQIELWWAAATSYCEKDTLATGRRLTSGGHCQSGRNSDCATSAFASSLHTRRLHRQTDC